MKKTNAILVGILTLILSLFCLVGCGENGVYKVSEYKMGAVSVDVDETKTESYIQLNSDKSVKMVLKVASVSLNGEGTWEAAEEKNTYKLSVDNIDYTVKIEKGEMTITVGGLDIVLVKE